MSLVRSLIGPLKAFIDRFPRMAMIFRSVRDQLDFLKKSIVTPWGFKLAGNVSMAQGSFEPEETELIRGLLKDVDVFVNVGANVGYYCCHALSLGKHVIAFEPLQRNFRYLRQNIKVNGWTDVELFPVALSDRVGVLDIYGGDTGASLIKGWAGAPESYVTSVPVSTMNLMLGDRLRGKKALVVVDIEGAEKWMLEGASKILANDPRPIWFMEITAKDNQPRGVAINPNFKSTFQIFFEKGYQAFNVHQGTRSINMEDVDLVIKDRSRISGYNFIFCDPSIKV